MNDRVDFVHRAVLLALWALPAVLALAWFAAWRARKLGARVLAPIMAARLLPRLSLGIHSARSLLVALAFAAFVVALARPRFGGDVETVEETGSDLIVLLDVSRSMLSEDVFPNRLERAKTYVKDLLLRVRGDRLGIVAFAGKPVIACPLTSDHAFVKLVLDDLDPDSAPRGGTAIGDAIRLALDLTRDAPDREKAFVLITDGEDHESFPDEAAKLAAEKKIQIFAVGIGDPVEGATIPTGGSKRLEYQGEIVRSRMDEPLLQRIAVTTGGAYVPARTGTYDLGQVYVDHLAKLRTSTIAAERRVRLKERFQWFLGLGLGLYLCALALRPTRRLAFAAAALALCCIAPRADAGTKDVGVVDDAVATKHEQGLAELAAGHFDRAVELFREAEQLAAGEPRVKLGEGFALRGRGDLDGAETAFRAAASGSDPQATRLAFQCLADLDVQRARKLLGDAPEELQGKSRDEVIHAIESAAAHDRSALRIDPDAQNARYDLELLRVWLKHIKEVWKQKDAEQAKQEAMRKDVVKLLEELIEQQIKVRALAEPLCDAPATPQRADLSRAAALEQRAMNANVDAILAKLAEQKAQIEASPPGDERDHDLETTARSVEAIEALKPAIETAAAALDADRALDGLGSGLNLLYQLYGHLFSMATFEPVLKHLLQRQHDVVEGMHAGAQTPLAPAVGASRMVDQQIVGYGAGILPLKADQMLDMLKQLEQRQGQVQGPDAEAQAKLLETLESLQPAYDKAKENGPKIPPLAQAVVQHLAKSEAKEAVPPAEEIERLLKEIADLLPKPPQDQNQDQNGKSDSNDQQDQNDNKDSKNEPDENDQDKKQQDENDAKEKEQQEQDAKKDESKQQEDAAKDGDPKDAKEAAEADPKNASKLSDREFKELMNKALAREKAYKDKKEKMRKALAVPAKVEKDW